MWGAVIRGAAMVVAGMLIASALAKVTSEMLPYISDTLGTDHLLYTSFAEINQEFVSVVILGIVLALVARAVVEGNIGGG